MYCGIATTEDARRRVFDFRLREYEACRKEHLLYSTHDLHPAEDLFDSSAHIFYVEHNNSIIATVRFVPAIEGEWELSAVLRQYNLIQEVSDENFLEASRLVVARAMRKKMIAERIIYFATQWLARNSTAKNYFAVCVPGVVTLFEKFGASLCSPKTIWMPSWSAQGYRLMSGNILRTHDTLRGILARGCLRRNGAGTSEAVESGQGSGERETTSAEIGG